MGLTDGELLLGGVGDWDSPENNPWDIKPFGVPFEIKAFSFSR